MPRYDYGDNDRDTETKAARATTATTGSRDTGRRTDATATTGAGNTPTGTFGTRATPRQQQPVGYQPSYDNRQPTPPPAKKRHWLLWSVLGVVAIIVVACTAAVASGGGGGTGKAGASATSGANVGGSAAQGLFQHPEDVTISKCGTDDAGLMTAQIVVHNSSAKASTYSIQIGFQSVDGKEKYADGYALINTLAAGQQQPEEAPAFKQAPGQFKCVVISAQRTQAV